MKELQQLFSPFYLLILIDTITLKSKKLYACKFIKVR